MRFSTKILLYLVPFYAHFSQARLQRGEVNPCPPGSDYAKKDEHNVAGKPKQLSVNCTPTGGEGTFSRRTDILL